jgi:precorrin 3B synthase CobZ
MGGGKALVNACYSAAERLGVQVIYDAEVDSLDIEDGVFRRASALVGGARRTIDGRAVVVAAGGFEANLDWLREAWGEIAHNFVVRGTPYNKGRLLKILLGAGAQPVGDPRACHAVAVDARAPRFDGGIVTRLDSVPFGIVVNRLGQRFRDEGEGLWPKKYATWGALVAEQPDQIAYSIVDAKAIGRFLPARSASWRRSWTFRQARSSRLSRRSTMACRRERSIPARSTIAGPSGSRRTRRIGRSASTPRRSGGIRSGRESRSPISASPWTTRRA